MTPKEKYQDIDLSKLPEKAVEQLEKVKPFLFEAKYESEENKEVKAKGEQALEKLYTLISEKYPESIKSKQAKAPEPKTPQAIAKKVAKDSVKQPAKGKSTASAKPTKRGEISRLAKEIRKDGERFQDAMKRAGEMIQAEKKKAVTNANKQYKKLSAFLKKNPIPAGSTTISRDAPRKALPAGKRTSKNGNTYYEYRQNRTDKHRKRYPYLALGGKLHGAGMFEGGGKYAKGGDIEGHRHTLHIDGQNWFLEKIDSTHFYMSNDRNHRGMAHHIGQHKGEPYYEEVKEWLKTTYAKGGVLKKKMTALWNEYQENEDENYHGENVVLLAKHFGTKEDLKEAKRILAEHEKQGYLTDKLRKERDELHHKLYPKFVKALKEEGVIMAKGGNMAKGGELYINKYAGAGMFAEGGIMDEATIESIHDGFTISEMNELLRRLFPYSFGFEVFKPVKGQDILLPDYDEAPSALRGYSDADLKSKLYFPNYKRDHDINFCINQGGENTYFYFTLNNENGDFLVGTFGFKDRGDVSPEYITSFIAFLMQCYDLSFKVKHTAYAKGGELNNLMPHSKTHRTHEK